MEIRFRVWDGEKMWYPEDGQFMLKQNGKVWETTGPRVCADVSEDVTVPMLSTGLKDKNGNEIWEGDVYALGGRPDYTEVVELATFLGHHYWLTQESGRDITYRVIGNKYENPELLEEVA